ncbi:MAG TPA: MFS transporter [Gaiellales bacterium]|nr:MFS transporter [Gaiellales bacterium]
MASLESADRRVFPVVPVTFVYNLAFSTFWVYVGVFAVNGLGWRPEQVGLLFLISAPPAAIANYLSGRISDRVGRRGPIVASFLAAAAIVGALALVGGHTALAYMLIVALGVAGAPAYSLDQTLVADLIGDGDQLEAGYATISVAGNLGVFAGPPLAALLVAAGGWNWFLGAVAGFGLVGAALARVLLPPARPQAGTRAVARPSAGSVLRDPPFRLLLASTLLGYFVSCGFETVLPVIAVSTYGIDPATWGFLVAINPLIAVVFQLRVIRLTTRYRAGPRLVGALLLMGLPFLLLVAVSSVAAIAVVIVLFVVGEMVWMPTSQALAGELAPAADRGLYFGALAATTGPAWTLAPAISFQLRGLAGAGGVWLFLAGLAAAAAAAGAAAAGASERRRLRCREREHPRPGLARGLR